MYKWINWNCSFTSNVLHSRSHKFPVPTFQYNIIKSWRIKIHYSTPYLSVWSIFQLFWSKLTISIYNIIITLENRDFVTGNKSQVLCEIEGADSESEVRICPKHPDFKLKPSIAWKKFCRLAQLNLINLKSGCPEKILVQAI